MCSSSLAHLTVLGCYWMLSKLIEGNLHPNENTSQFNCLSLYQGQEFTVWWSTSFQFLSKKKKEKKKEKQNYILLKCYYFSCNFKTHTRLRARLMLLNFFFFKLWHYAKHCTSVVSFSIIQRGILHERTDVITFN